MDTPLLIVFTRNPVKGQVKKRLAAATSDDFALKVYNKLRSITQEASSASGADIAVYYDDHLPDDDIFRGTKAKTFLQEGSDLGTRMFNAFKQGFSDNYRRIVLIGTDCPELTGTIIRSAFDALEQHHAVLGPAKDGGYYLIGLRALLSELFIDKQWSTCHVCREAMKELDRHGIDYALLQTLSDIDTAEDLGNFSLD
ncbi:TIGR04282 family arsenosugar biosynthesis glycosyltransferase [Prosthecochloris sp. SCSIO W1101]|uniref:TIGR04282 family arsenosugar biosynthesis glycosyltransferase n=1 Tax=Prosthecochloris sp. SCSIO W1101 TaxID=2992242 RepID=UPI00223E6BFF|nr:TIGR04282 family arsenosugar biosynthesis glycosyltransferase [Prosthecochloris sp. SCSIO W1101]UZJ40484.1 TIGR04282 family arsenosugar biosynthesis glycosyltransferase [Prosthecochloris sp. SCSIO W1101]